MCSPMSQTQFHKKGKSETHVAIQVPEKSRFRIESESVNLPENL